MKKIEISKGLSEIGKNFTKENIAAEAKREAPALAIGVAATIVKFAIDVVSSVAIEGFRSEE